MIIYFFVFFTSILLEFFLHLKKLSSEVKDILFYLTGLMLVSIAGFRYMVGTDYFNYMNNYFLYSESELSWVNQPMLIIVARISKIIFNDYATWFLLMSIITIVPIMIAIKKYAKYPGLSLIMYVLLGCWHFSFNLVKQSAAAAVLLLGFSALKNRKFREWIIICLVASLFHVTAILMVPVYFFAGNKISKKNSFVILLVGLGILFFYDRLFDLVSILKNGEHLVTMSSDTVSNSVNILRIIINWIPILLFVVLKKAKNIDNNSKINMGFEYDKEIDSFNCLFNISLLNAMLNVGSMNSIYLNRFCVYTNVFNILFIPILLNKTRYTFKEYKFVNFIILVLYFIFWIYDLYKGSTTVNFTWIFER